jgi:hypothetical protein
MEKVVSVRSPAKYRRETVHLGTYWGLLRSLQQIKNATLGDTFVSVISETNHFQHRSEACLINEA